MVTLRRLFNKNGERFKNISTILINISSGIGDALMAMPLVRALKQARPEMQIDVVASKATKAIFENNSYIREIFILELSLLKILKLIRNFRKNRYSVYVGTIPSNTLSQIFIPYLSNIHFRIKHRTPHIGSRDYDFLFNKIEPIPEGRHRIECNLDLLKHLDIEIKLLETHPVFHVSDSSMEKAKDRLIHKGYIENKLTIGFHPGCSPNASFKRWAPENYIKLINYLTEKWNAQILIVGGIDEEDDVIKIESGLTKKPLNFVGQAVLQETAALIKRCRFFVSNDSGIMHLATAVDVPVFAIFGPKDEWHIGPYGNKHTVIREGNDVNNVTVERVVSTLLQSEYGLKQFDNK